MFAALCVVAVSAAAERGCLYFISNVRCTERTNNFAIPVLKRKDAGWCERYRRQRSADLEALLATL